MTNNDVLRRIRYAFDFSDAEIMSIFKSADLEVTREQMSCWLKKDEDEDFKAILDTELATFLNGLINHKRGKREGTQPVPERRLTHNLIMVKLKIALNLKAEDVLSILALADFSLSKHELSAFFRKPGHRQYRECQSQVLRNFLKGIQIKYRPNN